MSDIGVSSHEANGESLGDLLHKARSSILTPPHEDTIEAALEAKINAVLLEQAAMADRRLQNAYEQLERLKQVMNVTSKKAALALKAYTKTLVAVRIQAENVEKAVAELADGHEELIHLYDKQS